MTEKISKEKSIINKMDLAMRKYIIEKEESEIKQVHQQNSVIITRYNSKKSELMEIYEHIIGVLADGQTRGVHKVEMHLFPAVKAMLLEYFPTSRFELPMLFYYFEDDTYNIVYEISSADVLLSKDAIIKNNKFIEEVD